MLQISSCAACSSFVPSIDPDILLQKVASLFSPSFSSQLFHFGGIRLINFFTRGCAPVLP